MSEAIQTIEQYNEQRKCHHYPRMASSCSPCSDYAAIKQLIEYLKEE